MKPTYSCFLSISKGVMGLALNCEFLASGAFDYVASLKQKVSTLNLERNIEWCGFISDPRDIFANIDVCIVPAHRRSAANIRA